MNWSCEWAPTWPELLATYPFYYVGLSLTYWDNKCGFVHFVLYKGMLVWILLNDTFLSPKIVFIPTLFKESDEDIAIAPARPFGTLLDLEVGVGLG